MTCGREALVALLLVGAACARAHLPEPAVGQQLWEAKQCFAHELPEWRHIELRELAGTVLEKGAGEPYPLPDSHVYARSWPRGSEWEASTDANGEFRFEGPGEGTYELAVCRDGWNPWRGTVRVSGSASVKRGTFVLMLGQ
jgi:Carboxypeptidase regulatory-like domain